MNQEILIPPIPKEYISYSEQEMVERTEASYLEIDNMYKWVDVIHSDYRKRVNDLLQNEISSVQLNELLKEKDARILCRCLNEFNLLEKLCQIAKLEEAFSEPCVLQNFQTIEEAVYWLQVCVFSLRKIEFDIEEAEELYLQIKDKKLSYICLAEIVSENWIVQKIYTAENLARYLYGKGQKREAVLFLMKLEQMLSYSDKKVMTFAMMLLEMDEYRLAYEVLLKYQNPNEDIKQLQLELGGLL